jgi:hypothetical protein
MRGIGSTFSRLPAARAFIAGVAILAGASASKAYSQSPSGTDDTAFAVPRVSPRGSAGVALPQPLAPSEAARLRRVFAFQSAGRIEDATRESASLDTSTPLGHAMLGYVLADRYLAPSTKPNATQLQDWLNTWVYLPDAASVHALLKVRTPRGQTVPPPPVLASLGNTTAPDDTAIPVPEETEPAGTMPARNRMLDRAVLDAVRSGNAASLQRALAQTKFLAPGYASLLRGEAARALFTANRDAEAYATAKPGATPDGAALAGMTAGLAAWRLQRSDLAQPMFEAAWHASVTTSSLRAGAAFWAARAHLANRDPLGWYTWIQRAGDEPRTFYGLLARRMQGLDIALRPGQREVLGEADIAAVAATEPGLRAFALLQIGQATRADAELRLLWPQAQSTPPLARAIMLVAERAGLVDLAAQLADLVQASDGRPRDAMRFPVPRLRPRGGFVSDPALVYGIARTESNFDPACVSPAGARGLMQIMPATARFVGADGRVTLHDPGVNLDLGQRYIAYLASLDSVGPNLLRILASYNSGPGSFAKWAGTIQDHNDPLLFIEAVPGDETRAFIARVLAYTWIYAARLRLPAPSLDELAGGAWPRYHPVDTTQGAPTLLH